MKTSTWTAQLTVASSKAQHYLNSLCTTPKRPPATSKFYVDFQNVFSTIRKLKLTCFFKFFAPCLAFLWAEKLSCSVVLPPNNAQTFIGRHFFFTPLISHCLKTALKVVWGKDTSRRSKEPESDLPSPFCKCRWRHHISRSGCGPDCYMKNNT